MVSIRSRLLLTLIMVQLAAGLASAWAAFYSSKVEFSRLLDEELERVATSVAHHGSTPLSSLTIVGNDPSQRILVQIYESRTNALFLSEEADPLPIFVAPGFSDISRGGETWRTCTVTAGSEIITAAQPDSARTDLAVSSSYKVLQPLLFLLPITAVAVWLIVGQGLAPLDRTARTVATRSPVSLSPIPSEGLPYELRSLVTSINRLMERLRESLEAQRRFASDAAHELRTPLTAIKLQAQLAKRAKTPEALGRSMERLDAGVSRATKLIEQLLTMARLDPDSAKRPFTTLSVDEVLSQVAEDMAAIAAAKGISIGVGKAGVSCQGNRDALVLLFTNLTDNAVKYTPEGGRVELASVLENDRVLIRVSDNGPGIPEAEREKVFKRFYRALGTKVQGSGLGLAIAARIAEIHFGSVRALPGPGDKGTTMEVSLPAPPAET